MTNVYLRAAICGALAISMFPMAQAVPTHAKDLHTFSIPSEDAVAAITAFGIQAGVQIIADPNAVQGKRFAALSGQFSLDEGLRRLLSGTGLTYTYLSGVISVTAASDSAARAAVTKRGGPAQSNASRTLVVADDPPVVEEIVVTAQRRTENLQEVPISAEVIKGQALIEENLNSLSDLSETDPSVHVGISGRSANMYIRGVGSGESQTFDQSVGLFMDDIYFGRGRMSVASAFDVDRIEILKGPQSTFFGNNAIAGAFNIVTAKPTDEFDASVRALYGQFGQYVSEGAVGGPLTETLSARAAVRVDGGTGWLDNETIGRDVPGESNKAGRLTFLFKPVDSLDATLKVEGGRRRSVGGLDLQDGNCPPPAPFVAAGFCKTAVSLGVPIGLDTNVIAQNSGQEISLDSSVYALTVNYRQWGQTFTSVSGYYNYRYNEDVEGDGTPANLLNIQEPETYHQFSEELRVASPTDQPVEYLAGVYFHTDQLSFQHNNTYYFLNSALMASPALAPLVPYLPLGQDINFSQPEQTYSAFGSTTWNVTDTLKLSAGLRGSWVRKSYDWNLFYGAGTAPYGDIAPLPAAQAAIATAFGDKAGLGEANTLNGSRDDHGLMPSARIQYSIDPAVMSYLSYSKGFKAGGFNGNDTTGVAANLPFAPEHVDAYEVGLKSEWFDRSLLLDLDLFRSDYTNLQVATNVANSSGAIFSLVRNAATARSQGVELEEQWVIGRSVRLSTNVTYDNARYINYPNVGPTQLQQQLGQTAQDLSGRPTEYAPDWSGTVAASYTLFFPRDYRLTTNVMGIFSSSYFLGGNDDPTLRQGAYARLDARVSLETGDGRWGLDVIGKNLTNQNILTFGIDWPTSPGGTWLQKEEPRNVAVQVRFHW